MTDPLVAHYIRAYGLNAVYVAAAATSQSRQALVGRSRNLDATLRWLLVQHGPTTQIVGYWWCASECDAQRLVDAVVGAAQGPANMCKVLPRIGAELGLAMASGETVEARALEAVEAMRTKLKKMKTAGELRQLNRSYRELRRRRAAAGLKTMPYPVFLRRYTIGILYRLAAEVRRHGQRGARGIH